MNPRIIIIIIIAILFTAFTQGQEVEKGMPASYTHGILMDDLEVIVLPPPNVTYLLEKDEAAEKQGLPMRVGTCLEVQKNLATDGLLRVLDQGGYIISLAFQSDGAVGSVLYYDTFLVPDEGRFFIYSPDYQIVHGAYTPASNPAEKEFATPFVPGNKLIVEYYHPGKPSKQNLPRVHIGEYSYIYRPHGFLKDAQGFGSSQWCEVNINCPEGDNWKNEKRGVTRILLRAGGGTFYCTGSLMNNTAQNLDPILLTADHCGQNASVSELNQWIFRFNYEAPACQNPPIEPNFNTLTGCQRLASSGGLNGAIVGADFYLVRLNQAVPPNFNPYYNGWNMNGSSSPSGVSIHHPVGDIKKISTYTQPTFSTQWGATAGTHWGVNWSATVTEHGVTEQGSSGSPLFDDQKRIIGVLTGGDASCNNQTAPDLYGKLSYAWNQPGSLPDGRLKDWLDPLGAGSTTMPGSYGDIMYVIADFRADTTVIPVNSELRFTDLSFGGPTSWKWEFEGANPRAAEVQHPSGIRYEHTGTFTVKLTASNNETTDEHVKLAYIRVIPNIYPNPVWRDEQQIFHIDFGKRDISGLALYLYDALGRQQRFIFGSAGREGLFSIQVPDLRAGVYYLRVQAGDEIEGFKLILLNRE